MTKRITIIVLLQGLVLAGSGSNAFGQQTGRLVGRVLDAETGRGLSGAQVMIQGSRTGAIAGVDGRFVIPVAPAGEQVVWASFLGYATTTVTDVRIPAGSAASLDIALHAEALTMEEIIVSAERERGTLSRALNEQRQAAGVVNAVTAEQIARSPDSDAAAAIQRVSGVTVQDGKYVFVRGLGERYTTTSLNGARVPSPEPERKVVPLDLFPAGLLQTITTSKTFTPNLPGDFSGAQVDIRTREFPLRGQLTISASSGINSEVIGKLRPMAPTVGGEWVAAASGPRRIPGVVEQIPAPRPGVEANSFVNAFRSSWSVHQRSGRPSSSIGASLGGSDEFNGRTIGYLISATHSAADEVNVGTLRENVEGDRYEGDVGRFSVLWGGLANFSTFFGSHSRLSFNNTYSRSADNEARFEQGFYENHGTNVQIERLRYIERTVRSHQLAGEHQLDARHRVDWSLSASAVSRQEPDRSEFVTWLDSAVPTWYNEEGSFRAFGGLNENALEGSLDYRLELGTGGSRHLLRLGALARRAERSAFDKGYSIRSREWTPDDPRWQMAPEEFFDGRFSHGAEALFQIGTFNAGGDYEAADRLLAGYTMAELAVSSAVRVVGGVRVEQSNVVVSFEDVLGNQGESSPSYTDVLPSLAVNLEVTRSQKLRLSASRTLARPEYREVAPIAYRSGLGEEQRQGNPDLRRTLIQNYDARWEWYPAPAEVVSFGIFAKRFREPIEQRYLGRSGTNTLWFENAESAVNFGIELEFMRGLGFLSEALTPFSAFSNVTLMSSRVRTGREDDAERAMVGQAPYVINTGLTYTSSRSGTSATLLYNVVGERIINARPSGATVENVLERPRPMLDFAVRLPLFETVSAKVDVKNILDSPFEVRQGPLFRQSYRSGRSLSLGVSWQQ
jgi:hypothetical protein